MANDKPELPEGWFFQKTEQGEYVARMHAHADVSGEALVKVRAYAAWLDKHGLN